MRYATALLTALALGAGASLYTSQADAGVVVSVGLPIPVVAPPVVAVPAPYYPYVSGAAIGFGVQCCGPVFRHPFYRPAFRGTGFYHPGLVHGGYYHPGFARGYRR